MAVSFLLHAVIVYLAIRVTAAVAIPEHSPIGDAIKLVLGGGGGGGGQGGTAFQHTPPPPPPPPVVTPVAPTPVPVAAVTPPVVPEPVPPPPAAAAPAPNPPSPAASAGSGTGSGGGSGSGQGPGTGSGQGPGSGGGSGGGRGNGNAGTPASSKQLILPPTDGIPKELRGELIEVTFYITATGLVSDIKVTPPIANRGFARKFDEIMRAYTFTPARDATGNRIASTFLIQFTLGSK